MMLAAPRKRLQLWCLLAVSAAVLVTAAVGRAQASPGPCGTVKPSRAHYTHVIWILEENHSYSQVIDSSHAPYINALASECGLATHYHNISHPSLPNYVGMTSGLALSKLGRFSSDCTPSPACSTSARSIFGETSSWRSYEESMPSSCYRHNSGAYAARHNPALYFTKLSDCARNDVPFTRLAGDLARGTLPKFAFVTPNLNDDMHNGTIAEGDSWLKAHLPVILHSRQYRSGSTVVFITWDEGAGGTSRNCAANTTDIGCHVATIVISPTTKPGTKAHELFNHYSLLATTEQLLGLPRLGKAQSAHSMKLAFGL